MKLDVLVSQIQSIDSGLKTAAGRAVNRMLTIRNWLIGYYIVHYEQHGEDRAQYGERLLDTLAASLRSAGLKKGFEGRRLREYRAFFVTYPQIWRSLSAILESPEILGSVSQEFALEFDVDNIRQTVTAESSQIIQSSSGQSAIAQSGEQKLIVPPDKLISNLSFSHLVELLPIADPLKRAFYEIEAIKGAWSVRELKRQIGSLYFERSGLSKDPARLSEMVRSKTLPQRPADIVKDIYTFEFLGLPMAAAVEESDLETALLDHLQQFILELGHGFCFEARQQRILIGDEYFFIDLVFYHRLLKCHVLIDLKVEPFTHYMAGQLNTYLNYYKANIVAEGDNPPIGILLVTDKNKALVEYATAGMDEQMFVKKYLLQLPSREQLQAFMLEELKKW